MQCSHHDRTRNEQAEYEPAIFSVGASSTGDFLAILYGDQINVLS